MPDFTDAMAVAPISDGYFARADGAIISYWRANGRAPYAVRMDMPGKILKPRDNGHGYMSVTLGARNERYIHRLVYEAFNGPIPAGMETRHLNGDRSDNRRENLAIGTWSDNHADKVRHGRVPRGGHHVNSRLTDAQVREARNLWRQGFKLPEIVSQLGTHASKSTVHLAIIGNTWAHLPGAIPVGRGRDDWGHCA